MATEIRVPTLGESVSEATIGKWFKKAGEAVKADEESSDAHYYLGLVRDERGDVRGALEEFLQSRALDLSRSAPA